MKIIRLLFLVLLLHAVSALAEYPADLPPDVLVKQVIDEVLASVRQDREITHDLRKMDGLVDAKVLPHFNFSHMMRLTIGGKYWDGATQQDQQDLVSEYRTFLAHTFSNIIAQYTNQEISFTPVRMQPDDKNITVRTKVIDPSDEPTELDYKMEKTPDGWKVYDVEIDNISLVRIYRSNFNNEIMQGGVPNLISVLRKKNLEVETARHD